MIPTQKNGSTDDLPGVLCEIMDFFQSQNISSCYIFYWKHVFLNVGKKALQLKRHCNSLTKFLDQTPQKFRSFWHFQLPLKLVLWRWIWNTHSPYVCKRIISFYINHCIVTLFLNKGSRPVWISFSRVLMITVNSLRKAIGLQVKDSKEKIVTSCNHIWFETLCL